MDVTPLRGLDVEHGRELHNGIIRRILEVVAGLESRLPGEAPFFLAEEDRDSILLFVSPLSSGGAEGDEELARLFDRIAEEIDRLRRQFPSLGRILLPVGRAMRLNEIAWQAHGQVLELIRRARPELAHPVSAEETALTYQLAREDIDTVFQPIVELETRSIVGLEALSRGPRGSRFETPSALLACAEDVGLLNELVRVCWRRAIAGSRGIPKSRKVFLKVLPSSLEDPELCGPPLFQRLDEASIAPEQIVLEISERFAVLNYARFRDRLGALRALGVRAAIDNMGSGYSGLDKLVELNPDYVLRKAPPRHRARLPHQLGQERDDSDDKANGRQRRRTARRARGRDTGWAPLPERLRGAAWARFPVRTTRRSSTLGGRCLTRMSLAKPDEDGLFARARVGEGRP